MYYTAVKCVFIFARTWYLGCVLGPLTSDPFGELIPEPKIGVRIYLLYVYAHIKVLRSHEQNELFLVVIFFWQREKCKKHYFSFWNVYLIISTVIMIIYFVKILFTSSDDISCRSESINYQLGRFRENNILLCYC